MSTDNVVKVVDSLTRLISALAWPAVALFVVLRFRAALSDLISNLGEFSIKGGGIQASGKRKREVATAALAAAATARTAPHATQDTIARDAREAAKVVEKVVTPRLIRKAGLATVLWVDDKPEGNRLERESLEALGISFVISLSTEDALQKIQEQTFDAIISDLSRSGDDKAGLKLLEAIRASHLKTPFFIYTGYRNPKLQAEAAEKGANGFTNRPNDLFKMILTALTR